MHTDPKRPSPGAVKRALLHEAEILIDEMLEWQQPHPDSDFDGMETQVQEFTTIH